MIVCLAFIQRWYIDYMHNRENFRQFRVHLFYKKRVFSSNA